MEITATVAADTTSTVAEVVLSKIRANARYQRAVALGNQNLSGSDLRGEAKRWSSYHRSREVVVDLWRYAGGHVRKDFRTGYLSLEEGEIPARATPSRCALGKCWRY